MDIVELMFQYGANDFNGALRNASIGGDIKIINLLVEKGANDWESAIRGVNIGYCDALTGNSDHTVQHYVKLNQLFKNLKILE